MANHRLQRINEEYKKALSQIISNEVRDPRITAMVSVTDVKVTNDLKQAKVYLSIFGKNKDEEKATFDALKKARGFIRSRLSSEVNLRNTPELTLIVDSTIDYGMHIDELLRQVIKPEEKAPTEDEDTESTEDEEDAEDE